MLTLDTIAVALAALEFRRIALIVELSNWRDGHSTREQYLNEIAATNAAIADLTAAQQGQQMPAPNWADAPEWAQWWAMDANGDGYWYESQPELGGLIWTRKDDTKYEGDYARDYSLWRTTLQQRT